ncbi:MAG: signal peptidase II [Gemmatimonadales bacterium]
MTKLRKARIFWPLLVALLLTDCATKDLAESRLVPFVPEQVIGDYLRFTLAYNRGAATGISVGEHSRIVFSLTAVLAVLVLSRLYRRADHRYPGLIVGLALVMGGAIGNLADRIRSTRGVVDFIDMGVGDWRFWTFNVADMGVSIGAVLLAWYLTKADRERQQLA